MTIQPPPACQRSSNSSESQTRLRQELVQNWRAEVSRADTKTGIIAAAVLIAIPVAAVLLTAAGIVQATR